MKLAHGAKIALRIVEALTPFCMRLEVAGSIRRCRDWVNDIDIVCEPKPGAYTALWQRASQNATMLKSGPQEMILRLRNGEQLDLWVARPAEGELFEKKPGNFGSLLLCRTGSKEHNIFLVEHAKKKGLRWNPHHGVFDGHGKCLASETEEEIFRALQLDFVEPHLRER